MQINWFTVIAQIINFLILMLLLKRFLYGPVIRVMDERQEKIIRQENEAAEKIRLAGEEAAAYNRRAEELEKAKEGILAQAIKEAERHKEEYLEQARREIDSMKRKWEESFQQEKNLYIRELRRKIVTQSCALARRVLLDLADAELEKAIIDVFMNKIRKLDQEQKGLLKESLSRSENKIRLYAAFELPEEALNKLEVLVKNEFEQVREIRFVASPDLICGIELEAGGYHLGWSIDDYLSDFEDNLLRLLNKKQVADRREDDHIEGVD